MDDEVMIDDGCGWAVAGVLTELEAAVLTSSVGDGGLAGTLDMAPPLSVAANDASFGQVETETA